MAARFPLLTTLMLATPSALAFVYDCIARSGCPPTNMGDDCTQDEGAAYNDPYYYRPVDGQRCDPNLDASSLVNMKRTYVCQDGSCIRNAIVVCQRNGQPRPAGAPCTNYDPPHQTNGESSQCGLVDENGEVSDTMQCVQPQFMTCDGQAVGTDCDGGQCFDISGTMRCMDVNDGSCFGKEAGAECTYRNPSNPQLTASICDSDEQCMDTRKAACAGKQEGEPCDAYVHVCQQVGQTHRYGRELCQFTGGTCYIAESSDEVTCTDAAQGEVVDVAVGQFLQKSLFLVLAFAVLRVV